MRPLRLAAAVAAVMLPGSALAQSADLTLPPANTDSPRLGALERAYYQEFFRDAPTSATGAGIHALDDRLPDLSAAAYAQRIARSKRYLAALAELDRSGAVTSPEDKADVTILRTSLEREIESDETEATWHHEPSRYTSAASSAIYQLFSRDFAPVGVRATSALARMKQIPELLAAGRANTTTVDATTADAAARNIAGAASFFRSTVPTAFAGVDPALAAQLKTASETVAGEIASYLDAMKAGPLGHPSGTYAIGKAAFEKRLALQEARDVPLDVYERVGERALDQTQRQFVETAKHIDPAKSPADVYAELGKHHPSPDALLSTAQNELTALRDFVRSHDLVTLPPEFDVRVRETPVFDRQTSLASMNTPGAYEKVATQAYYYVTPVEAAWTAAQREQHLSFYNDAAFPIISAHEVMPGHYLNFVLHKFERLSLVRALSGNPSYSEGWAHYDEQMMVDEGWGNGDPRVRLAQLGLALQREARYLVGLREHTQGWTVDQGTRFFMDHAYLGEIVAHREALRGTQDPLYGYYTLGKLEILKLRDDYQKAKGASYSLKAFHDAFLAHGNPPIAVVRTLLLGSADDGNLL